MKGSRVKLDEWVDHPAAVEAPQYPLDLGKNAAVHGLCHRGAAGRHEQQPYPWVRRRQPRLEAGVKPAVPHVDDEDADLHAEWLAARLVDCAELVDLAP